MLAEVSNEFMGQLIGACAVLAGIVVVIWKITKRTPPIESEFATKMELQTVRKEAHEARAAIVNQMQGIRFELTTDVGDARKDIDARLVRLDEKLDERLDILDSKRSKHTTSW